MKTPLKIFGQIALLAATTAAHAEQVCSPRINSVTPVNRFEIRDDGTVRDLRTLLVWQRCPIGFSVDDKATVDYHEDDTCVPGNQASRMPWVDAFAFVDGNWRLPTVKELMSIMEYKCFDPAMNLTVFPEIPGSRFWTSTTYLKIDEVASVDITAGVNLVDNKTQSQNYVRLVRDPVEMP